MWMASQRKMDYSAPAAKKVRCVEISFDYSQAGYAIREDIPAAYRAIWRKIGEPGNWWSGAQRPALVQEARNARSCAACRERKAALSPEADCGPHNSSTDLPDLAVDAAHRITTDPSRLSQGWLESLAAAGLSDGHYVELLSVVVSAISIDAFHRALGLSLEPPPEPVPGPPDGYRPSGAADSGAWVHTVQPGSTSAAEADLYPGGHTANVISAMSLVPDAVRMQLLLARAQYLPLQSVMTPGDNCGRAISRVQMELLAGRVSSLSQCFY